MWLMVMFDLPVLSKKQRKRATRFRNDLLDLGFQMSQYSIYMRFCGNREKAETVTKKVGKKVPPEGSVSVLAFTDKQYGNMQVFHGATKDDSDRERKQLLLL